MKKGNQTDFWGGTMFFVIGMLFLLVAYGVKIGDSVLLPGYSMGTPAPSGNGAVDVHYVVMNPSSYVYLTGARFTDRGFGAPSDAQVEQCPDYNHYKYGKQRRNEYMSSVGADEMIERFVSRDVVYLLGESDIDPEDSSMDTGCEAELQGSQRFERGTNFWKSLRKVVGPPILRHQSLVTVPGVAHDGHDMFTSEEGQAALFGQ